MVRRIAGYEIIGEVGAGAMATVYRARRLADGAEAGKLPAGDVAIKLLRREYLTDLGFRARFEREAKVIAALQHTAIVPVYGYGQFENQLYIAMAYMPHGSLAQRLLQGELTAEQALDVLARVATALDFAHRQGVVHRDLKASNVLFDAQDRAYLADFGIAWQVQALDAERNAISGTPAYMSPEQAGGNQDVGAASDLYALGVLAYRLLTEELPFRGETPIAILIQHMEETPPTAHQVNAALPETVDGVLEKALAKEPADRYGSAVAFVAALRRALQGAPAVEPTAESASGGVVGGAGVTGAREPIAEAIEAEDTETGGADSPRVRLTLWAGRTARQAERQYRAMMRWLRQRPALALGLATALGVACALAAVLLLRAPEMAVASRTETPEPQVREQGIERPAAEASISDSEVDEVYLPLVSLPPALASPTATAAPPANVRMLYDGGVIALLNVSGEAVSLSDVTLRRVGDGAGEQAVLDVNYLRRVAGNAVQSLPAGDCLQLMSTDAVRNRGVQKPPGCGTLRGWLATRETNRLFAGTQEGDAFEVVRGEERLASCVLGAGSCEFRVENE